MYPRTEYEMTQADLDKIIEACRPVPYIIVGGIVPRSAQENANDAWAELGKRMGFDAMTVQPTGRGDRFFTAVPSETPQHRTERLARETEEARHLAEWVDLILLAFDGAWRAGHDPRDIVKAIEAKQEKNERRTWPNWRDADPNKAIEHTRAPREERG